MNKYNSKYNLLFCDAGQQMIVHQVYQVHQLLRI